MTGMAFPTAAMLADPDFRPLTRPAITDQLRQIGVAAGDVLMVHVRLSALGWVVGGIDTVVHALQDAVGPAGTLLAFCGWDDSPYHVQFWPSLWQQAYDEVPAFDPAVSSARRDFGRFPERLRTWPGAHRSTHPEVSFTAVGPEAPDLLPDTDDPWGPAGPLGRLVDLNGKVLLLGAPLNTLTLCHHAEAIARVENKRHHTYRMPVRTPSGTEWRTYRTLDTFYGSLPYAAQGINHPTAVLADQAVQAGAAHRSTIGPAPTHLFNAQATVTAAVSWIERTF
ncbi:aminoglycoside 3-N-acetyltransferase [Kribbella albertanoniae]|uniref:Aminoglycoside N(3)-acetyltransferase n=2 Tax=Kribbella albertanoniae TaxID=1266829 RepID=A0A4R4PYB7_9ACTN|nr:aminoglycoside 3-N-acetyltransferase [Kribbella albertanoniae]